MVMDLERIDTMRRFPVDIFDDDKEQESEQLISPFEGRFYIKFADNQYKTFDQEIGEEEYIEKGAVEKQEENADVFSVDYAKSESESESPEDTVRLESAIVELFKDVTQLHSKQVEMELDEIHDEDLGLEGEE